MYSPGSVGYNQKKQERGRKMENFVGTLIRRERLRQNLSQEGLCKGICVVSYLSKIEQGKAEAGEDILLPLLHRLGIEYETDRDFLKEAGETVERLYEELFSGKMSSPETLQRQRERLMRSPFMLDTQLLLNVWENRLSPELAEFVSCMDRRQYPLYLLLRLQLNGEDTAGELLRLAPTDFYCCAVGRCRYYQGRYLEAIELLSRAYDLAAREGNIWLMCDARLFLGNCYSDTRQTELMAESYRAAKKIALVLGDEQRVSTIDYNLGSTYLELGETERAYALLQTVSRRDALYYHKLAIALEKLGRREEALGAVARGRAALQEDSYRPDAEEKMLALVEYRLLHPDYLHEEEYAREMSDCFAFLRQTMSQGFTRFHLPYMLELLEAERRYKEAYRLLKEFS